MRYKNILIKLSGEAISDFENVISGKVLEKIFLQIKFLKDKYNPKISIVIGGGNIFRGNISESLGLGSDTYTGDYMGILSTTINALALKAYFNNKGLKSEILNSLNIETICDKTTPNKARKILEEDKILIFGGGTGKPYVSTDTAAALRALETDAEVILMAKNGVDGAYTTDPKKDKNAKFLKELTFDDVLNKKILIIDHEMIPILKDRKIDIILFNMNKNNNIIKIYENQKIKKTIIRN